MKVFVVALLSVAVACADTAVDTKLTLFVPVDHVVSHTIVDKNNFHDLFLKNIHDTHRHFLTSPLVVIARSTVTPGTFETIYMPKGLNSVAHDPAFARFHSFLRSPTEKFGLLFDPAHFFHARFFDAPLSEFVIPSAYKLGDSAVEYPAFFVVMDAPEFEKFGFSGIKEIAKFNIFPTIVDPIH